MISGAIPAKFRGIPRNSAEFRGISRNFAEFRGISPELSRNHFRSQKIPRNSVSAEFRGHPTWGRRRDSIRSCKLTELMFDQRRHGKLGNPSRPSALHQLQVPERGFYLEDRYSCIKNYISCYLKEFCVWCDVTPHY